MYIYIYIYIYMYKYIYIYMYVCMYIYIYIERGRGGSQHGPLPQRTPGPMLWTSLALALQKHHGTIHCTNAGRISPTNPPFNCQSNRGLLPRKEPLAPCHGQILSSVSKGIMTAFPKGKLVAFIQRKQTPFNCQSNRGPLPQRSLGPMPWTNLALTFQKHHGYIP